MRVLCVLLPHFPLHCEAQRRPALVCQSAIITYKAGSQDLILDYSPELEELRTGMSLQETLSRYGELEIAPADVPYYWSVFNQILDSLEQVSPLVEGTELGLAYMGLDGLHLLYPSDGALISALKEAVPDTFSPLIGIAEDKFLAYLAAHHSPPGQYKTLAGDLAAFLGPLPCDILPVSIKSKQKLHEFGLGTLGQVAALPLGPLESQFGPEGKRIWELAQGIDNTPLRPRFVDETIEESTTLSSVTVSLEAIITVLESLLARVFGGNRLKGRGLSRLVIWTRTWDTVRWERKVNFKEPAMGIKTALLRIKPVLESYPQPGPVEQVGIKITRLGYGQGRQKSIFTEIRAKDHLLEDIKRLELRLDSPQVYIVKEMEPWSRIPERRFALTPLNQ